MSIKLQLYVYCRRNGVSRDGGLDVEREVEAEKDIENAVLDLRKERIVGWLSQHYDEISWHVVRTDTGKKVASGSYPGFAGTVGPHEDSEDIRGLFNHDGRRDKKTTSSRC